MITAKHVFILRDRSCVWPLVSRHTYTVGGSNLYNMSFFCDICHRPILTTIVNAVHCALVGITFFEKTACDYDALYFKADWSLRVRVSYFLDCLELQRASKPFSRASNYTLIHTYMGSHRSRRLHWALMDWSEKSKQNIVFCFARVIFHLLCQPWTGTLLGSSTLSSTRAKCSVSTRRARTRAKPRGSRSRTRCGWELLDRAHR